MTFSTISEAYEYYANLLLGPSGQAFLQWLLILHLGPWGNGVYPRRRASDTVDRYTADDYIAEWGDKVGFDPAVAALLRVSQLETKPTEYETPQIHVLKAWLRELFESEPRLIGDGRPCWRPQHEETHALLEFGYGRPMFAVDRGWFYEFIEFIQVSFVGTWNGDSEIKAHDLWRDGKRIRIPSHSVTCLWTYVKHCLLGSKNKHGSAEGDDNPDEPGGGGDSGGGDSGGGDDSGGGSPPINPDDPTPPDGNGGNPPPDDEGDSDEQDDDEGSDSDSDGDGDDEPPMGRAFAAAIEQSKETGDDSSPPSSGEDEEEEDEVTEGYVSFTVCLCQFI